jgi:hypothetical protein
MRISHSEIVRTSLEKLWNLLLQKVEHPDRTIREVQEVIILERFHDGILRQMKALDMVITERIVINESKKEIKFTLIDHPQYNGYFINRVRELENKLLELTYIQDWELKSGTTKQNELEFQEIIKNAVLEMKKIAER